MLIRVQKTFLSRKIQFHLVHREMNLVKNQEFWSNFLYALSNSLLYLKKNDVNVISVLSKNSIYDNLTKVFEKSYLQIIDEFFHREKSVLSWEEFFPIYFQIVDILFRSIFKKWYEKRIRTSHTFIETLSSSWEKKSMRLTFL